MNPYTFSFNPPEVDDDLRAQQASLALFEDGADSAAATQRLVTQTPEGDADDFKNRFAAAMERTGARLGKNRSSASQQSQPTSGAKERETKAEGATAATALGKPSALARIAAKRTSEASDSQTQSGPPKKLDRYVPFAQALLETPPVAAPPPRASVSSASSASSRAPPSQQSRLAPSPSRQASTSPSQPIPPPAALALDSDPAARAEFSPLLRRHHGSFIGLAPPPLRRLGDAAPGSAPSHDATTTPPTPTTAQQPAPQGASFDQPRADNPSLTPLNLALASNELPRPHIMGKLSQRPHGGSTASRRLGEMSSPAVKAALDSASDVQSRATGQVSSRTAAPTPIAQGFDPTPKGVAAVSVVMAAVDQFTREVDDRWGAWAPPLLRDAAGGGADGGGRGSLSFDSGTAARQLNLVDYLIDRHIQRHLHVPLATTQLANGRQVPGAEGQPRYTTNRAAPAPTTLETNRGSGKLGKDGNPPLHYANDHPSQSQLDLARARRASPHSPSRGRSASPLLGGGGSPARRAASPSSYFRDPAIPILSAAHRRDVLDLYEQLYRARDLLRVAGAAMTSMMEGCGVRERLQASAAPLLAGTAGGTASPQRSRHVQRDSFAGDIADALGDIVSQLQARHNKRQRMWRRQLAAAELSSEATGLFGGDLPDGRAMLSDSQPTSSTNATPRPRTPVLPASNLPRLDLTTVKGAESGKVTPRSAASAAAAAAAAGVCPHCGACGGRRRAPGSNPTTPRTLRSPGRRQTEQPKGRYAHLSPAQRYRSPKFCASPTRGAAALSGTRRVLATMGGPEAEAYIQGAAAYLEALADPPAQRPPRPTQFYHDRADGEAPRPRLHYMDPGASALTPRHPLYALQQPSLSPVPAASASRQYYSPARLVDSQRSSVVGAAAGRPQQQPQSPRETDSVGDSTTTSEEDLLLLARGGDLYGSDDNGPGLEQRLNRRTAFTALCKAAMSRHPLAREARKSARDERRRRQAIQQSKANDAMQQRGPRRDAYGGNISAVVPGTQLAMVVAAALADKSYAERRDALGFHAPADQRAPNKDGTFAKAPPAAHEKDERRPLSPQGGFRLRKRTNANFDPDQQPQSQAPSASPAPEEALVQSLPPGAIGGVASVVSVDPSATSSPLAGGDGDRSHPSILPP